MGSENERIGELGHLIRAAHAELGTLQLLLINAYERELNPVELGLHIANLGHQIASWERERRLFVRHFSESAQPAMVPSNNNGFVPELARQSDTTNFRRAVSIKKSHSPHQAPEQPISLDLPADSGL